MRWPIRSYDYAICYNVACTTEKTKLSLSPSAKQRRNPCSGSPSVYQDLSTLHVWPLKKAIVDLSIKMKGTPKRSSGNSSSPLAPEQGYRCCFADFTNHG